jgi:hypothetical protein
MKIRACVCILLVAVMTLSAADISGKWSGTFSGTNAAGEFRQATAFVVFKQNGTELTGTAVDDNCRLCKFPEMLDGLLLPGGAFSPSD